jgi:ABC exporter DevB family membrane fusion protein
MITLSRLVGLLILGVLLGAAASYAFQSSFRAPPPGSQSTNAAEANSSGETRKTAVHALGTLEPRDGALMIASPLVGTPVKEVLVSEGQVVAAGQPLIRLDETVPKEELGIAVAQRQQAEERQQAEVSLARQRLEAADLALEQAQAARGVEIDAQNKQVELMDAKLKQAQDDLKRLDQLARAERPVVSAQQVEQQRTLVKLATVERDASKTAQTRLEQSLTFNLQKAQTEKKNAEEALIVANRGTALAALDRQIKLAEHKLAQVTVIAPDAGTVMSIAAHPGELVSNQPLLQLANLDELECHAEVDVADLPLLAGRREATLTCRAFRGAKLPATIERVRNVAGAATLRPVDPRRPVDRTVATVVLRVDGREAAKVLGSASSDAVSALMGLQVDVEIPL